VKNIIGISLGIGFSI